MTVAGLEVEPWTVATVIWVIIGVAVIAALVKTWPLITGFVEAVNAVKELPEFMEKANSESKAQNEQLEKLNDLVQRIRHQTENDHKTNLREEITEALEGVNKLVAWTGRHELISDKFRADVQELQAWVQAHDEGANCD